jgi:hypothetical protein
MVMKKVVMKPFQNILMMRRKIKMSTSQKMRGNLLLLGINSIVSSKMSKNNLCLRRKNKNKNWYIKVILLQLLSQTL